MKSNSNPMLLEGRMGAVLQMYLDLKPKNKIGLGMFPSPPSTWVGDVAILFFFQFVSSKLNIFHYINCSVQNKSDCESFSMQNRCNFNDNKFSFSPFYTLTSV